MNAYTPDQEIINEHLSSQGKIIARNCRIEDLDVTGAVLGGAWASEVDAQVVNVRRSGDEMHLQLQAHCPDALKCVHLCLRQSGVNVEAKVEEAAYTAPSKAVGFDFPITVPVAANADANGYGVARLFFATSFLQMVGSIVTQLASSSFGEFLSNDEKVIAYNANLSDLRVTGAILGGTWSPNTNAQVECVRREATKICLQLQARCHDYLKGVHVTFRQVGSNIVARVDWAAAVSGFDCGFDFSAVKHVPVADTACSEGYGVSRLSFMRKSIVDISTYVGSTIQVRIRPHVHVDSNSVRVGLHWIDGENYGGWIIDRGVCVCKNRYNKYDLIAEFTLNEVAERIAGMPCRPSRLFPVVFFTNDGTFDNAWYRTTFEGAKKTVGMVICLYPETLHHMKTSQNMELTASKKARTLKKKTEREEYERKRQTLAGAEYIYIDGNNFCWSNGKDRSDRIGLALVDHVLRELNRDTIRNLFPHAKIRLFFDGGITHAYRPEFLERLNGGAVTICPGKADLVMLEESKRNGSEDKTFIISNDRFEEYSAYAVVKCNRLIRSIFHNSMLRIPDMDVAFKFEPSHFAHTPPRKCPCLNKDVSIRAYSNGKLLCADDSGHPETRPVVANRDLLDAWERFILTRNSDGTISFKSRANGKYVTAMVNEGGRLIALADKIDAWEKFWLTKRIEGEHYGAHLRFRPPPFSLTSPTIRFRRGIRRRDGRWRGPVPRSCTTRRPAETGQSPPASRIARDA